MIRKVLQFFPDIEEGVIKAGNSTFKVRFSSTESVETKKNLMLKKWTLNYFKDIMVFVRDELEVKVPAKQVIQDDMVVNDGMIDYNGYKLNIYMPIGKDYVGSAIYKGDKLIHHYKAQTPQGLTNKIKERYSSN
jgi:hypothetical protein